MSVSHVCVCCMSHHVCASCLSLMSVSAVCLVSVSHVCVSCLCLCILCLMSVSHVSVCRMSHVCLLCIVSCLPAACCVLSHVCVLCIVRIKRPLHPRQLLPLYLLSTVCVYRLSILSLLCLSSRFYVYYLYFVLSVCVSVCRLCSVGLLSWPVPCLFVVCVASVDLLYLWCGVGPCCAYVGW